MGPSIHRRARISRWEEVVEEEDGRKEGRIRSMHENKENGRSKVRGGM